MGDLSCLKESTFYVICRSKGFLTLSGYLTDDIELAKRFSSIDRATFEKESLKDPDKFTVKKAESEYWLED